MLNLSSPCMIRAVRKLRQVTDRGSTPSGMMAVWRPWELQGHQLFTLCNIMTVLKEDVDLLRKRALCRSMMRRMMSRTVSRDERLSTLERATRVRSLLTDATKIVDTNATTTSRGFQLRVVGMLKMTVNRTISVQLWTSSPKQGEQLRTCYSKNNILTTQLLSTLL